jgi:hypothetical protein
MFSVGTPVEVLDHEKQPIRTGHIAGPLTQVQYTGGAQTCVYPVELEEGFYSTDGLTFIKAMLVNQFSVRTVAK